jgi:sodium/bile acid cotransporter 7
MMNTPVPFFNAGVMQRLWSKYWFFAGIFGVVLMAFVFPRLGLFLKARGILNIAIFLAFLITGLTLETSSIIGQLKNIKVLTAALLSSLFIFPAIAYGLGVFTFGVPSDAAVGILILGVAPVTVASGTVMTAMALGNVPLSLFICVLGNFVSIFTIPFILNLVLQFGDAPLSLPVTKMLSGLVLTVLIPTILGQILRPWAKKALAPYAKAFSVFNQCLVLMIILNAVSSSADRILQAGAGILGIFLFMLILHLLILGMNLGIAETIGLDMPATAAFTIHVSQKTLTISYVVWSGFFALAFPMALIPSIAYHIVQMVADTFVAQWFRQKMRRA